MQELYDGMRSTLEALEQSLDPEDRAMIVPYTSSTPQPGGSVVRGCELDWTPAPALVATFLPTAVLLSRLH